MNLRELEYLVALDDHRHFGRAAEACFVTQPTLSTQIKKLEAELDVALIERSPRQVMLTDAGAKVVDRARVMLAEADRIRSIARRAGDPESGSLRLGLFPTLAPYLLPHVIPAIHERFPNLELLLVEEKTEVVVDRLNDGQLDVAILALPIDDPRLDHERLFVEDFVLAVPHGHPLGERDDPVGLESLANEHMLLLEEGHCLRDQALAVCQLAGVSERRGFRATSLETLRQMVAAGVGVTLLPELAVQAPVPESDAIDLVPLREPVPHREIAMFWRKTSLYRDLLPDLADIIRTQAEPLVRHEPRAERSRFDAPVGVIVPAAAE